MIVTSRFAFPLRLLALVLALTIAGAPSDSFAQTPPSAATTGESEKLSAESLFIQGLGDKAIYLLANKQFTPEERDAEFKKLLQETFDLNTIARFVIGRSWRSATEEQQKEYMHLFEALVIKTYSDRFALYTGEGFKVRSSTPEGEKDTVVNSDITHPDGTPPTSVTWRVRQKDGKLGVIDVIVEGVSMSVTQRQEYASVIQRNGGDINALLDLMRQRVGATTPPTQGQPNKS